MKRRHFLFLHVLVLTGLVLTALPFAAAQGESGDKIDSALLDIFSADRTADFIVRFADQADLSPAYSMGWQERGEFVVQALQAAAQRSQGRARAYLDGRGLRHQTFIAGNELYVWAGDRAAAETLAALPEVEHIRATRTYRVDPVIEAAPAVAPHALAWGIADAKADQFWSAFGFQGEGIVVAGIDTGVQWDHPALDQSYKCRADPGNAACWGDPSAVCGGLPCDNVGHGTHTMGTMVADDDPTLTWQAGMAPSARWIACKGCETTSCSDYALNACADWILAPAGNPSNRPHVVNNSWGGGGCNPFFLAKVQAWRSAGIFPAFSAGNGGPDCSTLGSPGDYQESFASAAHDSSGNIAPFSSRGPSCYGHEPYTKPNLSAPGVNICSTVPGSGWECAYSGTSMASPHVAGAVALLWSCAPGLIGQVDQTFQVLQSSADAPPAGNCGAPPDGQGNYTYGYGYLNVYNAGLGRCLSEGSWSPGPSMCFDLTRLDAEYFPATGQVYILGGRYGNDTYGNIYAFDPATGTCADTGAVMPTPISNYTISLLNDGSRDLLCTFGGRAPDGTLIRDVQCYDPIANTAFVKAFLPDAYTGFLPGAQVVVANQVYIFGGTSLTVAPYNLARTDRYDPVSNTFTQLGDLSLARGYIMAAAVDGGIYAFGGAIYSGGSLIAQTRTEWMAPYLGIWYDALVPELPLPSGEGRAFGFDTDSGYRYAGQIVLAGGGEWPNQTNEALLYDTASQTYDMTFPDLITARRDHAGVLVPLCTGDPTDGLPGMWVLGGRMGSDAPPYAPAEYLPLPCALPPQPCSPFQRSTAASHLPDPPTPLEDPVNRGAWATTDFQAVNLALETQAITARFLDPGGNEVYSFTSDLPAGGTNYYDPAAHLPPGFLGTLVVQSPQPAAMDIVHLEPPEVGGSAIFPAVDESTLGPMAYTPIDECSLLIVHNLGASTADILLYAYDREGMLVGTIPATIPPQGLIEVDPTSAGGLPSGFIGSLVMASSQPIEVTVRSECGGLSAFVAPYRCGSTVLLPDIPPSQHGAITTTILIQNPTPDDNFGQVDYSSGMTMPVYLSPWGTEALLSPFTGEGGSAVIHMSGPVVVTVQSISAVPGNEGNLSYRGLALGEATPAVALPVVLPEYQGWGTGDNVWVMNGGTQAAEVRVRYVATSGEVFWDRVAVDPGAVARVTIPLDMPPGRAAGILLSRDGQPIVALAGGFHAGLQAMDRQLRYAGTNFDFPYQLVADPTFTFTISGRNVTFFGSASGSEPIAYAWDFGDGASGAGQSVFHSYGADGTYNVVMTATNVWGFGVDTTSGTVTVVGPPLPAYWAYLPIVYRDSGP